MSLKIKVPPWIIDKKGMGLNPTYSASAAALLPVKYPKGTTHSRNLLAL